LSVPIMPEPYWPNRKGAYTLTNAMKHYDVGRIWCHYCKAERFYLLKDFQVLFGDVEVDDVIYVQRWRCVKCKRDDTLHMELVSKSDSDRQAMRIRRLDRVEYVRKVTWRDE